MITQDEAAPAPGRDEDERAGGESTRRPPRGKDRPQAVLEVVSRSRITPNLMRVVLGGEGIEQLSDNEFTDKYVKLLLPDPADGLTPPYDMDLIRREHPEQLPALRTYTVRSWDTTAGRIALDVVLHGETSLDGVAAQWADSALPGDRVAMRGAGGGYAPDPEAGFHLLIGDHSALPAIASALESLARTAPGARGLAIVQLDHAEDRLEIDRPAGLELRYLVGPRELLLSEVGTLGEDELGDVQGLQVFAHGERGIIKELRRELVQRRGIPRASISISAYWALGRIEDQFQAEKRESIGNIDG